jgi:hypothetical protein
MTTNVASAPISIEWTSRRVQRQAVIASEAARPMASAAPGELKPSNSQKAASGARPIWAARKVFMAGTPAQGAMFTA